MTTISAPLQAAPSAPASLFDIEALLGYRPHGSIALHLRRRRRPTAALRVDLPPEPPSSDASASVSEAAPPGSRRGSTDHEEIARALTGLVARVSGALSADVVIYGRPSDDRASMARYGPLLAAIRSRLRAAGFDVPRAIFVAGDDWATVDPSAASGRSGGSGGSGRSSAGDRLAKDGDAVRPVVDGWRALPRTSSVRDSPGGATAGRSHDAHHGAFVPITPASERRRRSAMAALGLLTKSLHPSDGVDAETEPAEADVIETLLRWNAALSAEAGSPLPSDASAVALLWSLRHRDVRDCVLLLCAWGFDAGVAALHEAREPAASTLSADDVYDIFLGAGTKAPDPAALRSAVDLLRHAVSCAPESLAPPALTMLAWLEWARGRGTVAVSYLEACCRIDPGYRLARLLRVVLENGFVPEWIGDSGPTLCKPR